MANVCVRVAISVPGAGFAPLFQATESSEFGDLSWHSQDFGSRRWFLSLHNIPCHGFEHGVVTEADNPPCSPVRYSWEDRS